MLIGEREREIFTPVFTRQEDVKPVKGFEQSWLVSLSDEFENVRYATHPPAGARTLTPNLSVSTLLEGRVQLKHTHSSPMSR